MNIANELASLQRINDRLISTANDDLQRVLEALLPKLLPLSNNEALREKQVVPILMHILRRIKPLETRLPLKALISLVRPDMLPFCCNLAMVFIDAGKKWHPAECWKECSLPLMSGLGGFVPFSPQSNALCYYSLSCIGPLSSSLSLATVPPIESNQSSNVSNQQSNVGNVSDVLGDWFLDVSLAQPGIIKGSAGSIQPGLSADRLARLTTKKTEWNALDMKQYKLDLIASLSTMWLPTPCAVAIAIVGSCDTDSDVAIQAVFKMSGARSILPDVDLNPLPVMDLLLGLCLPVAEQQTLQTSCTLFVRNRTALRNNVKCAILRWICKEMTEHFVMAWKKIVQLIVSVSEMQRADVSSIDSAYLLHIMELTAILAEKLPDIELQSVAQVLLQCAKRALVPFASLLSAQSASSVDSESGRLSYSI